MGHGTIQAGGRLLPPEQTYGPLVLEANPNYWDPQRLPRFKRIVFDNTLGQEEAVELVKTSEGRVDLVT